MENKNGASHDINFSKSQQSPYMESAPPSSRIFKLRSNLESKSHNPLNKGGFGPQVFLDMDPNENPLYLHTC